MGESIVAAIDSLTINDQLNYLLDSGHATDEYIQWGRGKRNVIIIGGKQYQYKRVSYLVYYKNTIIHALSRSAVESLNTNSHIDVMNSDKSHFI